MPETVAGAPAEPPPAYSEQQPSAHLEHNAHVEPLPLDDDGLFEDAILAMTPDLIEWHRARIDGR